MMCPSSWNYLLLLMSLTATFALAMFLAPDVLLSLTRDFKGPAVSRSLHPYLGDVGEPECVSRHGPAGLVLHVLGSWVPAVGQGCAGSCLCAPAGLYLPAREGASTCPLSFPLVLYLPKYLSKCLLLTGLLKD